MSLSTISILLFFISRVDELKKEQKELGLLNNNNNTKDDDHQQINQKFQELFKYTDIQGTPVLKAKLCLLVLSLPAYELCQLPMQDAAKVCMCTMCSLIKLKRS